MCLISTGIFAPAASRMRPVRACEAGRGLHWCVIGRLLVSYPRDMLSRSGYRTVNLYCPVSDVSGHQTEKIQCRNEKKQVLIPGGTWACI